jgi:coenzyme F420-reducing hydrogenase alpha subunit
MGNIERWPEDAMAEVARLRESLEQANAIRDDALEANRDLRVDAQSRGTLVEAIERHRRQIKAREAGRRISSVAADEELWSVLDRIGGQ